MNTASRAILLVALLFGVTSIAVSARQTGPAAGTAENPPMAETVFKSVQILKGIPVDEFIDTMGMFAAATAKDCTGCHSPEILDGRADAFAIDTPMIRKARSMVVMMNAINRSYFGGRKRVTCATCHANSSAPENVPNMAIQYGDPVDNPNSMQFIVAAGSNPSQIDQVFTKYLDALGGAQRLAGVTSFAATGTYSGWDTGLSEVPVDIYARAPEQLTTIAHRTEGDSVWAYDGRNGWQVTVNSAVPFTLPLTKGNLAGAQLDAMVALAPTRIRQAFSRWQISKGLLDDDRPVQILRGTNEGQPPVNFYFDNAGLLVRLLRWNDTAVGSVATQYDYSDYRDVGGIRRPFRWVRTSTINQVTIVLKEMRPNVAIDAARFARPTTTRLIK
jgi:hypothetical protein